MKTLNVKIIILFFVFVACGKQERSTNMQSIRLLNELINIFDNEQKYKNEQNLNEKESKSLQIIKYIDNKKQKEDFTKKIIYRDLYYQKIFNFDFADQKIQKELFSKDGTNALFYIRFSLHGLASCQSFNFESKDNLKQLLNNSDYINAYLKYKLPQFMKVSDANNMKIDFKRDFTKFSKNKKQLYNLINYIIDNKKRFIRINSFWEKKIIYKYPIQAFNSSSQSFLEIFGNSILSDKNLRNRIYKTLNLQNLEYEKIAMKCPSSLDSLFLEYIKKGIIKIYSDHISILNFIHDLGISTELFYKTNNIEDNIGELKLLGDILKKPEDKNIIHQNFFNYYNFVYEQAIARVRVDALKFFCQELYRTKRSKREQNAQKARTSI